MLLKRKETCSSKINVPVISLQQGTILFAAFCQAGPLRQVDCLHYLILGYNDALPQR